MNCSLSIHGTGGNGRPDIRKGYQIDQLFLDKYKNTYLCTVIGGEEIYRVPRLYLLPSQTLFSSHNFLTFVLISKPFKGDLYRLHFLSDYILTKQVQVNQSYNIFLDKRNLVGKTKLVNLYFTHKLHEHLFLKMIFIK